MDNLALVISLIGMVAFLVYLVRGIAGGVKKREGTKTLFKRSFIALAVFLVGFIVFGMTTEPPKETAKEPKQERQTEKTKEQKSEKSSDEQETEPPVSKPKEEPKQTVEKKGVTTKKEEQPKNTTNEQITPSGGLGDTLDVFERNYGENAGDQEMARFQNNYILPMFLDGQAWNIKIQFEATDQPKRTMKEALSVAQAFIPKDAQKVKEYDQPEMGRKVIEYKSELLKQRFPDSDPPGTFIVIASYGEAGKENEVFGLTIGVGNNP
ncbi:hypothetical protein [Geobacillus vulcani]|uniref:hypothetical protein n=1 Tax=Geobacillus vulcani TaxID=135517 RepID=UPI000690A430|nr:hypothetical protein [Geobacillus vulcani]